MQPFIAAMLKVRQAFYAAILRSLLRGKSLLQTILNIWIAPSVILNAGKNVDHVDSLVKGEERRDLFLRDVKDMFGVEERLNAFSGGLRVQFVESLRENPLCMLPSY